ncbi:MULTISPECIES: Panacea domain-containing protein [Vibrio]|jgi:hypothetical protein|uniref:Panacea domain-containing protein n=1 Tax=Vibrio TaxID=662 RepID=UPI0003682796|nr:MULTISPECIES: Panacea domain-containing protein [Vibrio]MBE8606177.1 SocA family protein [Vibrio sp. OPT10]OCH52911.1 hypothetical protein A6D96_08830 [Vibrio cyclitrophicus]PME42563.1 hypothetical protein BCV36_13820 [Vibrio cyclitrophicus]PME56463.1 hypothetical protein BCV37_22410 [Vibrio cyclitrophicus]PMF42437.1 hypothetical protein BCV15_13650 [Vibrio cyclitrophicus]
MNKLQNVVGYLCKTYPHKGELSKARLTKLVYLTDWFSALVDEKQVTDIEWLFNHFGPYVDDVYQCADERLGFTKSVEKTYYGKDKSLIGFKGELDDGGLSQREIAIMDKVISKTKKLYFDDFIDYVYSTYPVKSNERYSHLNLVTLAKEFKSQ